MGTMKAFLDRLDTPAVQAIYEGIDARWNDRAARLNAMLVEAGVPVRIANLSSIWTVYYTLPARYNWMLQFYLRLHGLALSWVGTGRLVFSLNYTDIDFDEACRRFVNACVQMKEEGWWWDSPSVTNRSIRRRLLAETLRQRLLPLSGAARAASGR
jgi:glutamate-1-semialdehyde 2,1-aminomutase